MTPAFRIDLLQADIVAAQGRRSRRQFSERIGVAESCLARIARGREPMLGVFARLVVAIKTKPCRYFAMTSHVECCAADAGAVSR